MWFVCAVFCFQAQENIFHHFASYFLVILFVFLWILVLIFATYQKAPLQNFEIPQTPKMKMHKKDISKRAVSTDMLANSALFVFGVSLKIVLLLKTL